jgi:hypothetical protein
MHSWPYRLPSAVFLEEPCRHCGHADGRLVIHRRPSGWSFTVKPEDRDFAKQPITNLNGPQAAN